jgi:hypothetical protein
MTCAGFGTSATPKRRDSGRIERWEDEQRRDRKAAFRFCRSDATSVDNG